MTFAALFTRRKTPYLALGLDCYDIKRDARTWPGGTKAIAHPPCRAWTNLAHFAKPRPDEKDLAIWALEQIRWNGGILEHPYNSKLWELLAPGERTVTINQCDWGHRATKRTRLFVARCGTMPTPPMPREPTVTVEHMGQAERERTPPALAAWLVEWLAA